MNCADCRQTPKNRCHREGYDCTRGKLAHHEYERPENITFENLSDISRRTHGNRLSRLEEIIEFAKSAGYKKIGLAFCIGLAEEAELAAKVFKKHFQVSSACCKIGGIDKDEHNLPKVRPEGLEIACNPVGQAEILNRSQTDLNVQLGLCLGHDILFQKYSKAPVTVLAVKDRALANNPLGALYGSYWRARLGI
jgi:uncharacterized metal-binding protein